MKIDPFPQRHLIPDPGRNLPAPPPVPPVRRRVVEKQPQGGPGTELKKLIGKLGFQPFQNCRCNSLAFEMDTRGPDWCEENLPRIIDHLAREADRARVEVPRFAIKALVRFAIRKARKLRSA